MFHILAMEDGLQVLNNVSWSCLDPLTDAVLHYGETEDTEEYLYRKLTDAEWNSVVHWVLWAGSFDERAFGVLGDVVNKTDSHKLYYWSLLMDRTATVKDVLLQIKAELCYNYLEGLRPKRCPIYYIPSFEGLPSFEAHFGT
jgi:hypothetical protein